MADGVFKIGNSVKVAGKGKEKSTCHIINIQLPSYIILLNVFSKYIMLFMYNIQLETNLTHVKY